MASFDARGTLEVGDDRYEIHRLSALEDDFGVSRLPYSMKVLLENLLRYEDGRTVKRADIEAVSAWLDNKGKIETEIAYRPARLVMITFPSVNAGAGGTGSR